MIGQNAYVEMAKYNMPGSSVSNTSSGMIDLYADIENGKIYTVGKVNSSNFNSTDGTSFVSGENVYLAVHDTLGNLIYSSVFLAETSGSVFQTFIKVKNGNVFIAGNIGSGTGGLNVTNNSVYTGSFGGFVVFFSASTIANNDYSFDYATYIGGSTWDDIKDIKVDNNYFYVVLNAWSTDIPVTNGSFLKGDGDIVVYRISLNNFVNNLNIYDDPNSFISYFGGSGDDYMETTMDIDNGNVYLAFSTYSDDLPVTNSSTYSSLTSNYIGGVMKIGDVAMSNNATASVALEYCTYIETNDNIWVENVAYGNNVFAVYGFVQGSQVPFTIGNNNAGNGQYFLAGISENTMNTNGDIDYYKLIGGPSWGCSDIEYYNSNFYIVCTAYPSNFVSTDGSVLQSTNGDIGVIEISSTSIINNTIAPSDFAVLLGGSNQDRGYRIKADANGLHILANSSSGDFPVSNGTQPNGNTRLYINLCEDGKLNYATFFENYSVIGSSIRNLLPHNDAVYVTNFNNTLSQMVTELPSAPINNSVVTKITFQTPQVNDPDTLYPITQTACQYGTPDLIEGVLFNDQNDSLPLLYTGGVPFSQTLSNFSYQWQIANAAVGPWSSIPGAILSDYLPVAGISDKYYRRLTQFVECGVTITISTSDVAAVIIDNLAAPVADAGGIFQTCPSVALNIGGQPSATGGTAPYTYDWDNNLSATANPLVSPTVSGIYTLTVTDALGCKHSDQAQIFVYEANAGAAASVCAGQPTIIGSAGTNGLAGVSYAWSPTTNLTCSTCPSTLASPSSNQVYTLTQTVAISGGGTCQTTDDVQVSIVAGPSVTNFSGPDQVICFGSTINIGTPAEAGFSYNWYPGTYLTNVGSAVTTYDAGNITMPNPDPYHYYLVATSQGCEFIEEVDVYTINAAAGIDGCGPRTVGRGDETPNINETYQWTLLSGPGVITGPTNTPTTTVSASSGGVSVYQLEVSFNGVTCTDIVEVADCGCTQFEIWPHSSVGCPSYLLTNDSIQLTDWNFLYPE